VSTCAQEHAKSALSRRCTVGLGIAGVCLAILATAAYLNSFGAATRRFASSTVHEESVRSMTQAACAQVTAFGQPSSRVQEIEILDTGGGSGLVVAVDLVQAPDSWGLMTRGAKLSCYFFEAAFANPNVLGAELRFGTEGEPSMVSISYTRETAERIEWGDLLRTAKDTPDGWVEVFRRSDHYKLETRMWAEVTSRGYPDSADSSVFPSSK